MSEEILRRSRLICYFEIDPNLLKEINELYIPQALPLCVYHFHYPALYYNILYQHFQIYFSSQITPQHLRMVYKGKQLPSDLPVGLSVQPFAEVQVTISKFPCPEAFKLMLISWKKGYTMVNKDGGCDHVYKKLNFESQMELFNLHVEGRSHGLNKIQKYQGNCIALRLMVDALVIERKQDKLKQTIRQYLEGQFGEDLLKQKVTVLTHNIPIALDLTLKELLQQWNYNDGYCYLKIIK